MLKRHYRRFLAAHPDALYFTAHSHHFWPDVTRDAMLRCWDDAARLVDDKWGPLHGERIPQLQQRIARLLDSETPQQLCFAPSTHDLLVRLLSCLPTDRPVRILTSNAEFHSFDRQVRRLEETGWCRVTRIPSEPVGEFAPALAAALRRQHWDLVFFSQVFFDSGLVVTELEPILAAAPDDCLVAIDGYHAFAALPRAPGSALRRAFYLAGGYKYAQGGEGCCFMHVPPGCRLRPVITGWFADFKHLATRQADVQYADDGRRFAGATFDPAALYRLDAVLALYQREGIRIDDIHRHVQTLQRRFLDGLGNVPCLSAGRWLYQPGRLHGHFLAIELPDSQASTLVQRLGQRGIHVDSRGNRLRFGFGPYHDTGDVDHLLQTLRRLPPPWHLAGDPPADNPT
ncbi:MAG: aminotransferase class V-fold PLP-dependent enzyme [Oceanospirillaceae bacterium]|nr:aminotransferase class V-fold PLP-dependent enzyme [Oceanospirillaceae bacterium]